MSDRGKPVRGQASARRDALRPHPRRAKESTNIRRRLCRVTAAHLNASPLSAADSVPCRFPPGVVFTTCIGFEPPLGFLPGAGDRFLASRQLQAAREEVLGRTCAVEGPAVSGTHSFAPSGRR
jgi:hypothetical protein